AVYQAYKDNPKAFTDKMKEFGFNQTLGLDLKGEPASYIPVPGDRNWSKIALPWMAYGYGILVTPLQTLTLYNAVANNGEMVKPHFVKEIRDVNNTLQTFEKEVINPQIVKPEVIKKNAGGYEKCGHQRFRKKIVLTRFFNGRKNRNGTDELR